MGAVTPDDLYAALDGLGERQEILENALAWKHGGEKVLMLDDMTSTDFEGRACPLVNRGYSRDGKRDKWQLVIGLLDEWGLAEINSPDYPGARLIVCRHPVLSKERAYTVPSAGVQENCPVVTLDKVIYGNRGHHENGAGDAENQSSASCNLVE